MTVLTARPVRIALLASVAAGIFLAAGCSTWPRGNSPYRTSAEAERNPLEAQQLTQEAASLIGTDPAKAEELLRRALTIDLYHGPAHNNLGVLYLNQHKLYEAASEFEWARKLMPGHPDPRMNLALTLERAGRIEEAMATYETALEVYPNHLPTIQALARAQVRYGREDDVTADHLREIALAGENQEWREWAKEQLAHKDAADPNSRTME